MSVSKIDMRRVTKPNGWECPYKGDYSVRCAHGYVIHPLWADQFVCECITRKKSPQTQMRDAHD